MKKIDVEMLVDITGMDQVVATLTLDVPDDFADTPECHAAIYEQFRNAVLNIDAICCNECGYDLGECVCGDED